MGVPFAREYGGLLANRSFGGAQVSRTFYARGQTGQQLLLGAYSALERQIHAGTVKMFTAQRCAGLWCSTKSALGASSCKRPGERRRSRAMPPDVVVLLALWRLWQRLLPFDERHGLQL